MDAGTVLVDPLWPGLALLVGRLCVGVCFVVHGLAQMLHIMVLTTAPARIFLGGGVMSAQTHLFERIRQELQRSLNHYVEAPELEEGLPQFIVPPGLGSMAGPLGALALAADAGLQVAFQQAPVASAAR